MGIARYGIEIGASGILDSSDMRQADKCDRPIFKLPTAFQIKWDQNLKRGLAKNGKVWRGL